MRFPGFTEEWEEHYLAEYLDFKNGLNPNANKFGSGIKFISVMDILNNDFITYDCIRTSVKITPEEQVAFAVEKGDMLFQRSSETLEDVGRANVYMDDQPAVFGGFVIRGKKKTEYNPMFFRYLLASPYARKKIIPMGAGAQHFNIGQDGLSKVRLHFPVLQEQHKIATLLRLIDDRISTQNKIIEDLKKLKSALYQEMFGSLVAPTSKLGQVAEIVKGKQVNGTELLEQGDYYVMNGGTLPSGWLNKFNTEANTISISEGGNSCGYVQYNTSRYWSGGHCYSLKILHPQEVSDLYLYHFLKWQEGNIMALRIGSGLPNIQKKDLRHFPIILPTITKQKSIISVLTAIDAKIACEVSLTEYYTMQKDFLLRDLFI